eukprot:NODE_5741_length_558_cov_374.908549.p1 GENE.NODE_5741_length_558_cov_374.908549~~NODE_5741_length_558_cov_374.908549.p1  ORF type:complete len:110 (+),score=27.48 NODE_5741_length_558_cov_374.908549:80-409(+)
MVEVPPERVVLPYKPLENLIGLRYRTTFTGWDTILKDFHIEESEHYSLVEKLGEMLFIVEQKANPDAKFRVEISFYDENDQTMFAVSTARWHGLAAWEADHSEAAMHRG